MIVRLRGLCVLAIAAISACGGPSGSDGGDTSDATTEPVLFSEGIRRVDLLVMVDNSNGGENQTNFMAQFGALLTGLTQPPCVSPTDPAPHACDPTNTMDTPQFPPLSDMHVGVVDSDLGTPGSSVPGCSNSDLGDDGMLNPIRNGQAISHHEPWTTAPPGFGRPTDCSNPNEFPSFIEFISGTTPADTFEHDFRCNAGLFVNGCGLESQLEAVNRALVIHDATDRPGNTSPNAGFMRENALLAIVMLTDEEDGSVRDCRFANGMPCDGQGAIDVYNPASTAWASMELNLRFYMYQPCGAQDPTWPLERYIDPDNPSAGLLALKPGHPERVVFAAIAGVPLQLPVAGSGTDAHTDWNRLLGVPSPNGPNDFCGRDSSGLGTLASAEGPISMQQANADLACVQRVVPACRREGSTYSPTACTTDLQYFAWPARRIVEVARRFDEAPLCNGAPCRNGLVTSICSDDYGPAMQQIIAKIRSRLTGDCLARPLPTTVDASGNLSATCVIHETLPAGEDACDATRGLKDPLTLGVRAPSYVTVGMETRRVCEIAQLPTDPSAHQPLPGAGWFYDINPDPAGSLCTRRISFTPNAAPERGSITRIECTVH